MTADMSSNPAPVQTSDGAGEKRSGLRTCLLVGVGCLAVIAIVICIAAAVFLPRLRAVVDDVQSQIGVDNLQDFTDLINPDNLIDGVEAVPTAAPDLCIEDLCLTYPDGLNLEAMVSTVPAALEPEFWAIPEHPEVSFTTYPLTNKILPHIGVYNTTQFRQVNSGVGDQLDELSTLLNTRPGAPDYVPLIPVFNAQQVITADVKYFDYDWGSGVRFVTFFSQGIVPITNHDVFYAFTGLSKDGLTLVTALLPISNLGLPNNPTVITGEDLDAFAQDYETYIATTESMLNGAGSDTFTPRLDQLDALMKSIQLLAAP